MEVITGPNGKTQIAKEKDGVFYVVVHTFHDGSENHPGEGVENLQEILESDGYTGKCPFIGCESIIRPEDIQGVLSDEFYEVFKDKMPTKTGGRRRTYRKRGKSRKTANILPGGL
jgi:hypothetical protein